MLERDTGPHHERERRAGDRARDLPGASGRREPEHRATRASSSARPTRRAPYPDHDPRITTSYGRARRSRAASRSLGGQRRRATRRSGPRSAPPEQQQPDQHQCGDADGPRVECVLERPSDVRGDPGSTRSSDSAASNLASHDASPPITATRNHIATTTNAAVEQPPPAPPTGTRERRRLSPDGRRRIDDRSRRAS